MQVVLIGSGNVATILGRDLLRQGYHIGQVWSRTETHAATLARELQAEAITRLDDLTQSADIYLVSVADTAVAAVASALSLHDKLILHTAGAVSKEVLKTASNCYGVLWPMKMIRKSMPALGSVTMVVDGNSEEVISRVTALARLFSPAVSRAGDAERVKMHMIATVTSNFTNHLYHLAADYCEKENIDFHLFHSIMEASALQVQSAHPRDVQAGPAYRGDSDTLEKHREILKGHPELERIYNMMSSSIMDKFGR